ncbi:hypothetical protein B0H16DRAFT_1467333 [Mycena metata]|uniref:Secreted protein n=1 Tax=Mycena metata TaxID=1033252 RepID=A0AAD7I6C0_9AGAR|nr:hypothetical protein B0H16DRAFT_1467333 [Mycena metata]
MYLSCFCACRLLWISLLSCLGASHSLVAFEGTLHAVPFIGAGLSPDLCLSSKSTIHHLAFAPIPTKLPVVEIIFFLPMVARMCFGATGRYYPVIVWRALLVASCTGRDSTVKAVMHDCLREYPGSARRAITSESSVLADLPSPPSFHIGKVFSAPSAGPFFLDFPPPTKPTSANY